jgi:hypothetical protein
MTEDSPLRTPQSAQLPSNTPKATRRIVKTLSDLAGPASSARLASRLGVQLTGRVASELASAKVYGFIALEDDKLIVTARGEAVIGDDEAAALAAGRDAVMSTGFATIIKKLMTRQADASVVAVRFEEDCGLPAGPSKSRAAILVKAAEETKLISNGRFDAAPIEDTIARVGELASEEATPKARSPRSSPAKIVHGKTEDKPPKPGAGPPERERIKEEHDTRPFGQAPSMQVVLQIDASKLTVDEIVTIAKKLKEVGASTSSS